MHHRKMTQEATEKIALMTAFRYDVFVDESLMDAVDEMPALRSNSLEETDHGQICAWMVTRCTSVCAGHHLFDF
ncbi:MAG: hypothetical protein M8364_11000 [Methylobacter sp.]|uniref:hypothetical protein n=1 Tax=Methylobacter sp. TaxID=2051955 RepID=UPI0025851AC4|nr:hypothetical protein [Methylobacter sp.]MCL7421418.1 hypothetical protein [Methylobacter sp.]